ncbi:MAG: hypothetical protein ABIR71_11750 [Chthoniobacterales bacterium]
MHKDRPPGIFDFPHRSVGHGIGLGLTVGVLLSAVVHLGLLINQAGAGSSEMPLAGADAAQKVMAKHKKPPTNPAPSPSAAVKFK